MINIYLIKTKIKIIIVKLQIVQNSFLIFGLTFVIKTNNQIIILLLCYNSNKDIYYT